MSADRLARDYSAQARSYLRHATESLREGTLPVAVRLAQESTELSLKAALRWAGIDYPRDHDVVGVLLSEGERFPRWFLEGLRPLAAGTSELARRRGISMYGLEAQGRPASELFRDRKEVSSLVEVAKKVHELTEKLLSSG